MWTTVQCAVQGKGHIKDDIPCQDKTYTYNKDGTAIIVLADGAGSAKRSHYGAEYITQYICNDFIENFDLYFNNEDGAVVKKEIVKKIQDQIHKLANELKCEFRDLASTLLMAATKDDKYILLHIGDGVIGYLKEKELKIASHPENGEFVNTTIFTTSRDSLQTMKLIKGRLGTIDGFVLMSDGTETSLYYKREKKLADALKKIMQMMILIPASKVEEQLFDSFSTVVRSATTDDCSIAIMVNNHNGFSGYLSLALHERAAMLQINVSAASFKKSIKRYDEILIFLMNEHTLKDISRKIHLKPKYTKRYLTKLEDLNLVEKRGCFYKTIVIMN